MSQTSMNLREYLAIFFRYKKIFITVFILCAVSGGLYLLFTPRIYRATSLTFIQRQDILNPLLDKMAVSSGYREQLQTMKERILSWPRLINMTNNMKMLNKVKTPLEYEQYLLDLRKKIDTNMPNQDLVEISYESTDPYLAKQVVDYLTNSFIDDSVQIRSEEAVKAIDFIRSQLEVYRSRLEASEKDLGEMKISAEIESVDNKKMLLQEQLAQQEKVVVSEVRREQNPIIKQLNDHIVDMETQLSRLLIDATETHPTVRELRKEIAKTRDKLAQEMEKSKTINVEEKSSTNPIYADLEQQLKTLELRKNTLLQRQEAIKEKNKKYKFSAVSDSELSAMDRDARVNEQLYSSLLSRLESARISQQMEIGDKGTKFKVVSPARLPLRPFKPNVARTIIMIIGLGIGLGFGAVFLMDNMDHSLRNVEDAKEFFEKPLLGAISKIELDEDAAKKVKRIIRG